MPRTRLNVGIDYGAISSLNFKTTILKLGDGSEQRIAHWQNPLISIQLGQRVVNQAELEYLLNFHAQAKGGFGDFLIRDWSDYQAVLQPLLPIDGGGYRLQKIYSIGDKAISRILKYPIEDTLQIFSGGDLITDWDLSEDGVITFAASHEDLVSTFDFDILARFSEDTMNFRFVAADAFNKLFELQSLTATEIRDDLGNLEAIAPPATLNLGYDYETLGGPAFNTTIFTKGAGYQTRVANHGFSRGRWQVGDRNLLAEELLELISFFRLARGQAGSFQFFDWQIEDYLDCRFDTDSISFRFEAKEGDKVIFYLSGAAIAQTGFQRQTKLGEVVSSYEFNLGYPPNGSYLRQIEAPEEILAFGGILFAYLVSAEWDNQVFFGTFARDTLGTFSGNQFLGVGQSVFPALINQVAAGPAYLSCSVRWEAWE